MKQKVGGIAKLFLYKEGKSEAFLNCIYKDGEAVLHFVRTNVEGYERPFHQLLGNVYANKGKEILMVLTNRDKFHLEDKEELKRGVKEIRELVQALAESKSINGYSRAKIVYANIDGFLQECNGAMKVAQVVEE